MGASRVPLNLGGARLLALHRLHVRFGSLADIAAALPNVRFIRESGHRRKPALLGERDSKVSRCGHARDWRIDGRGQRAQHLADGVERRYEEPS
jgi:hypothetical protein